MSNKLSNHLPPEMTLIGHALNEQGTGYEYLLSIEMKNRALHPKEHPKVNKFAQIESYWFKLKGIGRF